MRAKQGHSRTPQGGLDRGRQSQGHDRETLFHPGTHSGYMSHPLDGPEGEAETPGPRASPGPRGHALIPCVNPRRAVGLNSSSLKRPRPRLQEPLGFGCLCGAPGGMQ